MGDGTKVLHGAPDSVLRGNHRELQPVGGAHFLEDVRQVMLDGFFADCALICDFSVGAAGHHHGDDTLLACGQSESQFAACRFGRIDERTNCLDEIAHQRLAEPVSSGHDARDCLKQHLGCRVLQNHPANPQLNRLEKLDSVDGRCEQDGSHAAALSGLKLAKRLEARHSGHAGIEKEEIRSNRLNHFDDLFAAARFTNDPKSRSNIHAVHFMYDRRRNAEEVPQARPKDALRVCEHHRRRR